MSRPLCHVILAAVLPIALGACTAPLSRMATSFAPGLEPAAPVRGEAPWSEEKAPSVARADTPLPEPPMLERGLRCGTTPGEQARAQCLRGSPAGGTADP
jgi:hypothetical protein